MSIDVQQQLDAFSKAPALIIGSVLVIAVALFWIFRYFKAQEISDLKSRIALRDDEIADYKRKLDGASPDEAAARINDLEAQLAGLAHLKPRGISDLQRQTLIAALGLRPGALVRIIGEISGSDAPEFPKSLMDAFSDGRWEVDRDWRVGVAKYRGGIGLTVTDANNLTDAESAVSTALNAAGLPFEMVNGEIQPTVDGRVPDLEISIGHPRPE